MGWRKGKIMDQDILKDKPYTREHLYIGFFFGIAVGASAMLVILKW